jgi:hypothetical protein
MFGALRFADMFLKWPEGNGQNRGQAPQTIGSVPCNTLVDSRFHFESAGKSTPASGLLRSWKNGQQFPLERLRGPAVPMPHHDLPPILEVQLGKMRCDFRSPRPSIGQMWPGQS